MTTDPVTLVSQINATIEQMKTDNKAVMAELKKATEDAGAEGKAAMAKADELAMKIQAASQSIVEMEQKLADKVHAGKTGVETLGMSVIKSDAFKEFAAGRQGRARIEANTITGQSGSPATNSDTLVPSQRLPGIIPGAFRSLKVRDMLPQGATSSNIVEYTREMLFTNNAAETAEAAQKPESVLTFELASAPVRTIATFLKVSKQVLEDATALQSYIDTRLRYAVDYRYDQQLLNGNGTGQNISGITDSGNFTAFTPETGDNQLDTLNRMIESVALADYAATGIIMNVADWHAIERLKVGTSDDRYLVGNPTGMMMPMLWGLPVVATNAMTQGKAVVAAFDIAYQVWNRSSTVVEIFEQDDTNVQKNLLTIRAENRGTLATYRPASSYYGNLLQA